MHLTVHYRNDQLLLFLPPKLCLTSHTACQGPTIVDVVNATGSSPGSTETPAYWMEVTNYFCYVTLPVVFTFCILSQCINIMILVKQIRLSIDTYLLGLSIASLLFIIATIALCLQHYVGYYEFLVHVQHYALVCHNTLWYTSLWTVVLLSLERSLMVMANRTHSLCTTGQATLVVVLVLCIGLISALPRYWEYQVQNAGMEIGSNTTILVLEKSSFSNIIEYRIIYYWYVKIITVFVPLPLLFFVCFPLCCAFARSSRHYYNSKYVTHTALILNRRVKEEIALTKLIVILSVLYIFLTGPLVFMELLPRFSQEWMLPYDSPFYITLQNIFTVCFYLYYMVHQQLYFCYNKQFRLTLLSACCCCC